MSIEDLELACCKWVNAYVEVLKKISIFEEDIKKLKAEVERLKQKT